MNKTEAVYNFLQRATSSVSKWYHKEMEVLVDVAQDYGIRCNEKTSQAIYEDKITGEKWSAFRLPTPGNAATMDSQINFDLLKHAEGIGMSGWNFVKKKTFWVGFDFDSIINHKAGLTEDQLDAIQKAVTSVPYVNLFKSTSGKGYHVYLKIKDGFPTESRSEHIALSKTMLQILSVDCGQTLTASVDVCGAILWCWHRKQEGTDGLTCLKEGVQDFPVNRIPPSWRESVKNNGRKYYSPLIEEIANAIKAVQLDAEHRSLLEWLKVKAERSWWFDPDYSMLVAHTFDLEQASKDLNFVGAFRTKSSGSSSQNCFCFPKPNGVWVVRRYSKGVNEHELWDIDEGGWTKCLLNSPLDFDKACLLHDGLLDSSNFYTFSEGKKVNRVFRQINVNFELPEDLLPHQIKLKLKKKHILVSAKLESSFLPKGFTNRDGYIEKMIRYKDFELEEDERILITHDDEIRHVVVANKGETAGWFIKINDKWITHNKDNVADVLIAKDQNLSTRDIRTLLGEKILAPWELVVQPFKPEYVGGRKWNKYAPQFSVAPEAGECKTWLRILKHVGHELNLAVKEDEWCMANDVKDGSEYLLLWIASMFQKPEQKLPYLFFWSRCEDNGKSTLHEALSLLFKDQVGYSMADHALKNQNNFNLELLGAVLCVIEETDLSSDAKILNKIKEYVTGQTILIRAMRRDAFQAPNFTHWMQFSNFESYCPIKLGDTRIISICVPRLDDKIPKDILMDSLKSEAPAFLESCLKLKIPKPYGRLGLPTLKTTSKSVLQEENTPLLDTFINEKLAYYPGHRELFSTFCAMYEMWLISNNPGDKNKINPRDIGRLFKHQDNRIFKAKAPNGQVYIHNTSFLDSPETRTVLYIQDLNGKVKEIGL